MGREVYNQHQSIQKKRCNDDQNPKTSKETAAFIPETHLFKVSVQGRRHTNICKVGIIDYQLEPTSKLLCSDTKR